MDEIYGDRSPKESTIKYGFNQFRRDRVSCENALALSATPKIDSEGQEGHWDQPQIDFLLPCPWITEIKLKFDNTISMNYHGT